MNGFRCGIVQGLRCMYGRAAMKYQLTTFLMLWAAVAASGALPSEVAFDRYQVILDRKPFGDLPPAEGLVNAMPQAESFAKSLRLSTIIDVDDGTTVKVGFVDTRTGKSYMLMPGESQDGIEVVSANWIDEEAILRQGAEMALIKLASGVVTAITPAEQQKREQTAVQQGRPSYEERRRMRQREQEREEQEPPPQPRYTGDALKKHLQEYQMEVIRQGLPPLPIPLTPEMDKQLVTEGVLPP